MKKECLLLKVFEGLARELKKTKPTVSWHQIISHDLHAQSSNQTGLDGLKTVKDYVLGLWNNLNGWSKSCKMGDSDAKVSN